MNLSDKEWKKKLTPEQYRVLREKGTETPFSGEHVKPNKKGQFHCIACGSLLFSSDTQYESTTPGLVGWPSFADVAQSDAIELKDDNSLGMHRVEVVCKTCGGHLGHLFPDDSSPNGQHYCINSCVLNFEPQKSEKNDTIDSSEK